MAADSASPQPARLAEATALTSAVALALVSADSTIIITALEVDTRLVTAGPDSVAQVSVAQVSVDQVSVGLDSVDKVDLPSVFRRV